MIGPYVLSFFNNYYFSGQGDASTVQATTTTVVEHVNEEGENVQTVTFTIMADSQDPAAIVAAAASAAQNGSGEGTITIMGLGTEDDLSMLNAATTTSSASLDPTPTGLVVTTTTASLGELSAAVDVMDTSTASVASEMDTSTASVASEMSSPSQSIKGTKKPTSVKTPGKWAKYKKRYNVKWESEPGLMEWIRRVPGDETKALCRFCRSIHRAHRNELTRHSNSQKHKSQSAFVVSNMLHEAVY